MNRHYLLYAHRLFCAVLLLFTSLVSPWAREVTEREAEEKALRFLTMHSGASARQARAAAAVTVSRVLPPQRAARVAPAAAPTYYIYNADGGRGFVVIAGESEVQEVLAYSLQGEFHPEYWDKGAGFFLDGYDKQISMVRSGEAQATVPQVTATTPILLTTANWDQDGAYFNDTYAPKYEGESCYSGCVATAMAEVMQYHRHPQRGRGSYSYTSEMHSFALSCDFSQETFNWDLMPSYVEDGTAESDEVSRLILDCGIAVAMDYGTAADDGSGALMFRTAQALKDYFYYDNPRWVNREWVSSSEWDRQIIEELQQGRPVLVGATSRLTGGGHAFVADGVDASGVYHYNMGWGGYNNGYYTDGYITSQYYLLDELVTEIRPVEESRWQATSQLSFTSVSVSASDITAGTSFTVTYDYLMNIGPDYFDGQMRVELRDKNDNFKAQVSNNYSRQIGVGYYRTQNLSCVIDGGTTIEAGDRLWLYTCADGTNWYPVTVGDRTHSTVLLEAEAATSVTLNKTATTIVKGNDEQLTATLMPEGAQAPLKWESSDETVATVTEDGLVTAVSAGTATITVSTTDGTGVSATCQVTVEEPRELPSWTEGTVINGCDIWSSAIELTGLNSELSKIRDSSWDGASYGDLSIYTGAQWDYCLVPQEKLIGHTLFVLSDATLGDTYGITSLQGLYDKARALYGGEALDVNDTGSADKFRQNANPLYRMVAYHILKGMADYDHLTTITTIETTATNPTEWYSTMYEGNLLKVEQITTASDISALGLGISAYMALKTNKQLFLNHSTEKNVRGAKVIRPDEDGIEENVGQNYCIYELDALVDYTSETQQAVFNTVMRIDLYTMFPELMTNGIRSDKTNEGMSMSNSKDALCKNYWFPNGYIEGLTMNDDAVFFYQGPHNTYWSYEGDEFDITSDAGNYDITIEIPPLPEGRYQIRLGFANMDARDVCQFYFDENPLIPLDMRSDDFYSRSGWVDIYKSDGTYRFDEETTATILKNMHAKGWYHGPKDVFSILGEGHEDGDPTVSKNYFVWNYHTVRYVIGNQPIQITGDGRTHTIRIRSVEASSGNSTQIDYFEFVPESEWGDWTPNAKHDFEQGGIFYKIIDENSVEVTSGAYSGDIVIPSAVTYEGTTYNVTTVGEAAFLSCEEVSAVYIPESVGTIGKWAFSNCTGLTSVMVNTDSIVAKYSSLGKVFGAQVQKYVIGERISAISYNAFRDCTGLTSIVVEPNNETYDSRGDCNAIIETASNTLIVGCKNIVIPEDVMSIGDYAFSGCSGLTSISIPESVTSIGRNAFSGCHSLTKAEFASIESLCAVAFTGVSSNPLYCAEHLYINGAEVFDVVIPDGVASIGDYAFMNGRSLTSVAIPSSVVSIGSEAFSDCTSLTKAEFASIMSICSISFENSSSNPLCYAKHLYVGGSEVKDLDIPYYVGSIGNYAFYNCLGLTSVTIPKSVMTIGYGAFSGCKNLPVEGGLRYADTYLVEATDVTQSTFNIKEGTRWIGDGAFFHFSNVISVTMPESVTSIGSYAFNGCSNLREVVCKVTINPIVESTGEPTVPTVPEPGIDPYDLVWLLPFNPAHPVEEATMSNYTETDNTDLYNKVYPEDECREKWTEYYQAVKSNLGTAARRLNVSQQVTIRMYSFMDTDRYLKRKSLSLQDEATEESLYAFNPKNANPTEDNFTQTVDATVHNVYSEREAKAKWLEYCKRVSLDITEEDWIFQYIWDEVKCMPYLIVDDLVNKTTYINEWGAYENGRDQYESAWQEYKYLSSMPETGSNVFYNVPQSDATLYVYASVIDAYRSIEPWSLFGTILPIDEEDPSAVETLPASEDVITTTNATAADAPIYDIMGRRLTEKPTSGIYIQNGRKYLVK